MKIDIDTDDLILYAIIGVLIVCSPFVGIYDGIRWLYKHTPWVQKKKKIMDREIQQLEEKLGLHGRDDKALYYDPCYYKNKNRKRKGYLNDLKTKLEKDYKSPDIIIGIRDYGFEEDEDCDVLILVHKKSYDIPKLRNQERCIISEYHYPLLGARDSMSLNQDYYNLNLKDCVYVLDCADLSPIKLFLGGFRNLLGRLRTLSECGRYEDYYIVHVPGKFQRNEVIAGSRRVDDFINKFKQEYTLTHCESATHTLS